MSQVVEFSSMRVRRRHPKTGVAMFPSGTRDALGKRGHRWLYAVGFNDDRVKFGIADNPRKRVSSLVTSAGGSIRWAHIFGVAPEVGTKRNSQHPAERIAIDSASAIGERIGRSEYVRGLSKEQALQCMRLAIAEVRETVEA